MQESNYRLDAKNTQCGLVFKVLGTIGNESITSIHEECVVADIGISQINYKTAKLFKFNIMKLINNLEYSIEAGAIILADFKRRYSHREKNWWSRYNASSKRKRLMYEAMMYQYL